MGSSETGLHNDDDSATVSNELNTETDSEMRTQTDEECPSSHPSSVFVNGEKVLASHAGQYYEAKVIRALYEENKWGFYVHYTLGRMGWNGSFAEAYRRECAEAESSQRAVGNGAENKVSTGTTNETEKFWCCSGDIYAVSRGRKRKNDSLIKEKDAVPLEKPVNLQIPPTLKKQLLDDCKFITHRSKLVKLPRTPNVQDICKKYREHRSRKDIMMPESTTEIMKGLCCYFDKALPVMLLYKSERQQYADAISDNVSPSMVYGAEHLLRLFVKLPELLAHANIEEETLTELHQKLAEFLKFLQKNQSAFFLATYHVPEDSEANNKQDH